VANSSYTFTTGDLVTIRQGTRAARTSPTLLYVLLDKLVKGIFLGKVPEEEKINYDIMYLMNPCRVAVGNEILVVDSRNINHHNKRRKNEKVN
jgi:hypothetical protein